MRRLALLAALVLLALLALLAAPAARAQAPVPDCSPLTDEGERLKCKNEVAQAHLSDLVDTVTADGVDVFTPTQREHLRRNRDRSRDELARTPVSIHTRRARKADPACLVVEFDSLPLSVTPDPDDDGNNDGICDRGELCAEVVTDGIGDDDGKCERWKEKGGKPIWETCREVCDDAAVDAEPDNEDAPAAADMEAALDDAAAVLVEAQDTSARLIRQLAAARAGAPRTDPCAEIDGLGSRAFTNDLLESLQAGANLLKAAAGGCRAACDQLVFGSNCRAACLTVGIAFNVTDTVARSFESKDDDVTDTRLDAAMACIEQLEDRVSGTGQKLDQLQADLRAMVEALSAGLDHAIDLAETPQGQRPGFPGGP